MQTKEDNNSGPAWRVEKMSDIKDLVKQFEKIMQCNCDRENWIYEPDTGHTHTCRIHKATKLAKERESA